MVSGSLSPLFKTWDIELPGDGGTLSPSLPTPKLLLTNAFGAAVECPWRKTDSLPEKGD